ncbi:M20/M25/M40 family metallo-hydrolase [Pseudomonas sp. CGJS7]|uniref:M20/M25/M40 family metallo-hydrolase n=1 Tax=Pseudomonas sp. CGJS7 TaxID=3109348 RepID=UPI00300ADBC1
MKIRSVSKGLLSLALLSALSATGAAHAQVADRAQATPANADTDPLAPVYIVTSRKTYDEGVKTLAGKASALINPAGVPLVVSELKAHQLNDVTRHVHELEKRCGGYFAFRTREQAEAFVRNDLSAQAITANAVAYTLDNQATVNPWLPQVSEANIRGTIHSLSTNWANRSAHSSQGVAASSWLRDRWLEIAAGRSDVSAELVPCTAAKICGKQHSVVLTLKGNELADEVVVLGAHLDSINTSQKNAGDAMQAPGADDDASGVATLTEVLRVAMASGYKPKRTIKFMGYAAEEIGLGGSNTIANDYRQRGVNVVGVLQLDMTNYRAGGDPDIRIINDNSNESLKQMLTRLFDTYLAGSGLRLGSYTCNYGCSDHSSWTTAGFPAAMYFEGGFFPKIHTPDDTLANLGNSAKNSLPFAKLGLAFLGELGKTSGTATGPGPGPGTGAQTYSNGADYAIKDNATVDSPISVSGRSGNASATTRVSVNIQHTYKGELKVDLVAPDGSLHKIHDRTGGSADHVVGDFVFDLSGKGLNGTWKLRVNDNGNGDVGKIDSWSITF